MIEPGHEKLSLRRQAALLGINRNRLQRLMSEAGIAAVAPKRRMRSIRICCGS